MKQTSTVLVVDDEPVARDALEALLASAGYRSISASNGPDGLARAVEHSPDAILLDVMMPGMDGFEVCRRVRADARLAEVPIIMVTALDDRDSRLEGLHAGADDFIAKPFDSSELEARLQTITRLNRYRRLMAERARFEWIVEHSEEGYLILDDKGEIGYANSKARLYLGLPADAEAPLGQSLIDLARRRYRFEPQSAWQSWPDQIAPSVACYLVQPETSNARAFWLQVEVSDLPLAAEMGRVIRLRDVTAQQALQRDIYSFQSLVSHKLITPFTPLLSGLELAKREVKAIASPGTMVLMDAAVKGARHLYKEILGVLTYLDSSALTAAGEGFALKELEPLIASLSAELELGSVAVTLPADTDLSSARLTLSSQAMELALSEILENAIKFHPKRSPMVQVTVTRADDASICLQVRDDGVTLSPEQLARVWAPYYQAERVFTGSVSGLGLGLPLVAMLVWNVGGTSRLFNRTDSAGVVVELVLPQTR